MLPWFGLRLQHDYDHHSETRPETLPEGGRRKPIRSHSPTWIVCIVEAVRRLPGSCRTA
jgi:hypothetical protein